MVTTQGLESHPRMASARLTNLKIQIKMGVMKSILVIFYE